MSAIVHALTRRGLEAAAHATFNNDDEPTPIELPASAVLVLALTILAFGVLLFSIKYTYGGVVATLCMVEEPETNAYVPVHVIEPEDASGPPAYSATPNDNVPKPARPTLDDGEVDEVLLIRSQPITSSLRETIKHLRARAGYWSRFRGLGLFVTYSLVQGLIVSLISSIPGLRNRGGIAIAAIITETLLCRYLITWIHIVISEPRAERWYKRVPPMYTFKRIAPVVAVYATTSQIAHGLPMFIIQSFGSLKHLRDPNFEPGKADMYTLFGQSLMAIFLVLGLFVLLEIPATVTMVRVAASMLPEEDETIIPFDRTFGGKVTPAIVGGSGRIGMIEAWRSFTWASRHRLLKLIAKVFLMILAVWFIMSATLITEAHLILGDKLGDVMKTIHNHVGPRY